MSKRANKRNRRRADRKKSYARQIRNNGTSFPLATFHNYALRVQQENERASVIFKPVRQALAEIDNKANSIFSTLLLYSSPDWPEAIRVYRDQYNHAVSEGMVSLKNAADTVKTDGAIGALKMLEQLEAAILIYAANLNDAIKLALVDESDNAAKLLELAKQTTLAEAFDAIKNQTDSIARDRRFSRSKVHIGYHMNRLHDRGVTKIPDQWQTIFYGLKSRESDLKPNTDEKAALDFFKDYDPDKLEGKHLRGFEKLLSSYQTDMKTYWLESQDKGKTKSL